MPHYYISHAEKFPSDQRPKAPLFISLNYTATEQREKREWVSLFKTRKVIEPYTVTKTLKLPLLLYSAGYGDGCYVNEFFSKRNLGKMVHCTDIERKRGRYRGNYIDEGPGRKMAFQTWYVVPESPSWRRNLVEMCPPEAFLKEVNAIKKQLAEAGISEEDLVSHINKIFDVAENKVEKNAEKKVEKSEPVKSEAEKALEEMLK